MKLSILTVAILALLVGVTPVRAASFRGLADLPGGEFSSAADAVSADGRVVVGSSTSDWGSQAFRWTEAGGMTSLDDLPVGQTTTYALAVSADGSVIVGNSFFLLPEAFRWTAADVTIGLGNLPGGNRFNTFARGVSADGSVVVGSAPSANGTEAFRWTAESGMVGLGDLPGDEFKSEASGVSADGSVIVGGSISHTEQYGGVEAFHWTVGEGMIGLGTLRPDNLGRSTALAVTADGSVVVGWARSFFDMEAFRWTPEGGMVGLGMLGTNPEREDQSRALSVSGDGSKIVGYSSGGGAFLWDATHGMRDLEDVLTNDYGLVLDGWDLQSATGISADGTVIVGHGVNPLGHPEAWQAVIPEPSSFALLAAMAMPLTLAYARHKRRRR